MKKSHLTLALTLSMLGTLMHNSALATEFTSDYFGRWVIDDPTQKFSSNGREYLVIDIAQCGEDFCGKSVTQGACGKTLFRFLKTSANKSVLSGHGAWGAEKMQIQITNYEPESQVKLVNQLYLGLGDKEYDITARDGNIAIFENAYHRIGNADCPIE